MFVQKLFVIFSFAFNFLHQETLALGSHNDSTTENWKESTGNGAQCKNNGVGITVLDLPPYFIEETHDGHEHREGLFYDLVCEAKKPCLELCEPNIFNEVKVRSLNALYEIVLKKETNIVLPVSSYFFDSSLHLRSLNKSGKIELLELLELEKFPIIVDHDDYQKECQAENKAKVLKMIKNEWPCIVYILLMALIAGIVVWLMEKGKNNKEFPKSFIRGSTEGFWWAIISMTTVGYGDKAPKSVCGRMFGMLWIFIGIFIISAVTATFTSSITLVSVKSTCNDIHEKQVAILNGSRTMKIANKQGAYAKVYSDVHKLFNDLDNGKVKRALVEQNIAFYYMARKKNSNIKIVGNVSEKQSYYMVLIKDTKHSNQTHLDECSNQYVFTKIKQDLQFHVRLEDRIKHYVEEVEIAQSKVEFEGAFDVNSPDIVRGLYILTGIYLGLFLIGLLWDFRNGILVKIPLSTTKIDVESGNEIVMTAKLTHQLDQVESGIRGLLAEVEKARNNIDKLQHVSKQTS